MRIDRLLANAGLGTRKEVRKLIKEGRVQVDGEVIHAYGEHIDYNSSLITVDGFPVHYQPFYYVLLHKPKGYISSTVSEDGAPPVTDLIYEYATFKLVPVGRLDKNTTGVLLLTNDGKLTHRLLSPKHHVDKVYEAIVDKTLSPELIDAFSKGINVNDEYTSKPARLEIINENTARVTLQEGKFHQVKRMFLALGYKVLELQRIKFAFLHVDDLHIGEYRELSKDEIAKLRNY